MAGMLTSLNLNLRASLFGLSLVGLVLAGCGGGEPPQGVAQPLPTPECADVTEAVVSAETAGTFRFDVTVRSTDTGWEKYADAWEIRDMVGAVLGTRVLTHPHEDEQPFTRSLAGVEIPDDVLNLEIAARDSVNGFCGEVLVVEIPLS